MSIRLLAVGLFGVVFCGVGVSSAFAGEGAPQWSVSSVSRPTNFAPGGDAGGDAFVVTVTNSGSASGSGPVTVTAELPAGVEPAPGVSAEDELGLHVGTAGHNFSKDCGVDGEEGKVSCTYSGVVVPDDTLILSFPVRVAGSPVVSCAGGVPAGAVSCVTAVVRVSGGGARGAVAETPTAISEEPAGFGISPGGASSSLSSVQAGAHPDLTVSTAFNTVNLEGETSGDLKNTTFDLPPGFAGDIADTPACEAVDFLREECPPASQVGITAVDIIPYGPQLQPVYNLAPEPGEVAKIGFWVKTLFYEGDIKVREPGEGGVQPPGAAGEPYGLKTTFYNTTAGLTEVDNVSLTVWGVPSAAAHDPLRWELGALINGGRNGGHFGQSSNAPEVAYFTNPTSCTAGALQAGLSVTSWQHPTESSPVTLMSFGPMVGCDALVMEPAVSAEVSTDKASAASGLNVATKIPQTYNNPQGLATPTVENEVVTLPEGMTVNPSSGAGLAACSEAEYAEEGEQYVAGHGCPNESRLASVKISSPSLKEEATGSVFIASPAPRGEAGQNPFDSLLAVYLVARIPNRGVLVKAAGLVQANELTGQITTSFQGLPPLPFTVATFSFNQGANAPLVTPPTCGLYEVKAALTPQSDPAQTLTPLVAPFAITQGFDGGACPAGSPPFDPQVEAGTENNDAGAYSSSYIRISRTDGEAEITGFSTQLPPGLTANLNGIPFCSETEIQQARETPGAQQETSPSCPAASEIGHTIAEAGVGTVLAQTPGRLYLAGPFEGAPFSVVSVTSAKVGPFDLGTVVVHLPLEINPRTADVSIPEGPADQIPHIIKGIVIHLRNIRVYVNRPSFMLDPTSCEPMTLSATVVGSGESFNDPAGEDPVSVSDPFQVADCSSLQFAPKFAVSTSGKTSKSEGASLTAKVSYPPNAVGTEAWLASAKVELPKALPSRLTTLQKACTSKQFEANPAGCPPESVIGHAIVHTQILPVPLEGPAYFVSHGGEAFPNLVIVLQGYGVTIKLVGDTFISKAGITSSTFASTPDVPFETFELTLPEGKYSALAANGNLCQQNLLMPTAFVGQNGATLNQDTHIEVTDCSKTLSVISTHVSKRTLKVSVYAPGAGKVKVSGAGLTSATKGSASNEAVSFTLTQKKAGKLATRLKVVFTPSKGKRQTKSLKLKFRR